MSNRKKALVVLLCCLPAIAQANTGTALMWAGMLHLLFGNAIIGCIEAGLLLWWFKAQGVRGWIVAALMISANYFSTWVGGFVFGHLLWGNLQPDLYSARLFFWLSVVVAYVLTLALEWPFVALCLGKGRWGFKQVLKANVAVQTVTYVMLFGWYWVAQEAPLYREAKAVPPSEISFPSGLRLYYISKADGDVHTRILGQDNDERLLELDPKGKRDRLYLQASEEQEGSWDLVALCFDGPSGRTSPRHIMVVKDIGEREAVALREGASPNIA